MAASGTSPRAQAKSASTRYLSELGCFLAARVCCCVAAELHVHALVMCCCVQVMKNEIDIGVFIPTVTNPAKVNSAPLGHSTQRVASLTPRVSSRVQLAEVLLAGDIELFPTSLVAGEAVLLCD